MLPHIWATLEYVAFCDGRRRWPRFALAEPEIQRRRHQVSPGTVRLAEAGCRSRGAAALRAALARQLARHGPREHRRHFGEGVEEGVVRVDRMGSGFVHGSWIPRPSDIPRWYLARAEDAVVRVDRMGRGFAHPSWIANPSDIPR